MDIKINLNMKDTMKDQLESGEIRLSKADGRTIDDYMVVDSEGNTSKTPIYMGYEVLDLTEDEENIIICVGKKLYDWKPNNYDFNLKKMIDKY
jgi:hypothetical protein